MNKSYFVGFLLIVESWLLLLLPSLINDEYFVSIIYLVLYISAIAIFFTLILKFLSRRFSLKINYFFCSLFLLVFFMGLILSTLDFFLNLNLLFKILFFITCILLISGIAYFIIINKNSVKICLVFFLLQLAFLSFQSIQKKETNFQFETFFNKVVFKKKPNIYFFSFDGLSPEKILKVNFDLDINFEKKISDKDFVLLKNSFSENLYTKSALNTLFFLDPDLWRNNKFHKGPAGKNSYFSGISKSPLYEIFKHNDYKIASGYVPGAWALQGKFSDEYNLNKNSKNVYPMYCRWQLPFYYLELLYFCKVFETIKYSINSKYKLLITEEIRDVKSINDFNYYLESIKSVKNKANSQDSWIFFQHIYRPGHTENDFTLNERNLKKFKKKYVKRIEETFLLINLVIKTVTENDPNSILVLYSDHGALLTKTSNIDFTLSEQEIKFQILDKHGVFMGIMDNQNLCKSSIINLNKKNSFITPVMVLNKIINCLSESNHIKFKSKYTLPYPNQELENNLYE